MDILDIYDRKEQLETDLTRLVEEFSRDTLIRNVSVSLITKKPTIGVPYDYTVTVQCRF